MSKSTVQKIIKGLFIGGFMVFLTTACMNTAITKEDCEELQEEYEDNGGTNSSKYQWDGEACITSVGVEG